MVLDPMKMDDPEKIRNLMKNAEGKAPEIVTACKRRLFQLSGRDYDDPIERRIWEAVAALEEILSAKNGRRQAAGYTRRKIRETGAIKTLSDWALSPKETEGFVALINDGLAEFTGEFIIMEHPDRFDDAVLVAARERLERHGVSLPSPHPPKSHPSPVDK